MGGKVTSGRRVWRTAHSMGAGDAGCAPPSDTGKTGTEKSASALQAGMRGAPRAPPGLEDQLPTLRAASAMLTLLWPRGP